MARAWSLGSLRGAAHQPEGDVFPDFQAVEQRTTLEQHTKAGEEGVAVGFAHIRAVQRDATRIGRDKAEDGFQQHRFSGARAADHHHALPARDGQIDAAQDVIFAEGFGDAGKLYHDPNITEVSTKLAARIRIEAVATAFLVARSHALRTATGVHAIVAADQRGDEAEHSALDQRGHDVGGLQKIERVLDVAGAVEAELLGRDQKAAHDADDIADARPAAARSESPPARAER